jgi:hypothetical protein
MSMEVEQLLHQQNAAQIPFPLLYSRGRFGLGYDRSTPITDLKYSSGRCRDPGLFKKATC